MQCTTGWRNCFRRWGTIAHYVAVVSLVLLAVNGLALESLAGWPLPVGDGLGGRCQLGRSRDQRGGAWPGVLGGGGWSAVGCYRPCAAR